MSKSKATEQVKEVAAEETTEVAQPIEKQAIESKVEQIIRPVAPPVVEEKKIAGVTLEERLLNFLKGKEYFVRINEFLKMEFKHSAGQQDVNKRLRLQLQELIKRGKIEVRNDAHKTLGTFYYEGNDPQTKYKTVLNTVLEVVTK